MRAFGKRSHLLRGPRRRWIGDWAVGGHERERDAVDLRVLGSELAVLADDVRAPAQPTADDLLAQQLASERSDSEDVGDRIGVPSLGEHRHRHDAADVFAEPALLPDGVHDLAQKVFVGELVHVGTRVPEPVLVLEHLDLVCGSLLEGGLHALTGLELGRVDQDGPRSMDPVAVVADVGEQGQGTRPEHRWRVVVTGDDLLAADPVVDQLRHLGVGAHDDEHRGRLAIGLQLFLPGAEAPGVGVVQAAQRSFENDGRNPVGLGLHLRGPPLGELVADVLPEMEVAGVLGVGDVVVHRHPGDLHDPGLDGVHEREVADRPREDVAGRVAGATEVVRRRGQVVHRLHAHPGLHGLQTAEPDPGALVTLLGLGVGPLRRRKGLVLVAVVRLVVEHEDLALAPAHEVAQHPVDDLVVVLHERIVLPCRP